MNIKTIIKITPIFILILLISSCDEYMPQQEEGQPEHKVTGVKALQFRVLPGSPPEDVYENSEFTIRFNLKNIGPKDIEKGIVNTVFEDEYFRMKNPEKSFMDFELKGKTDYYPGEELDEMINMESKEVGNLEAHDSTITIKSCFQYTTHYGESICIDTDTSNANSQKSCTIKDITTNEGQGAPIMVYKVRTSMAPTTEGVKPIFDIYLKNPGGGDVIGYNSIDKICGEAKGEYSITSEDLNKITVEEVSFSDYKFSENEIVCNPSPFDINKDEYLRCTTNEPLSKELGTFTTQLTIKLKYTYMKNIKRDITINKFD